MLSELSRRIASASLCLLLAAGCGTAADTGAESGQEDGAAAAFPCDPDDGGLTLPAGFCAVVFADELGSARHLAVDSDGDVYVARQRSGRRTADGEVEIANPGGVIALRDTDGDGKADRQEVLNETPGTGLAIHDGHLYYSSTTEVFRSPLPADGLVPEGEPTTIVSGFPSQAQHAAKSITFDDAGNLYVNVGGPSNACQEEMRTPGSPGVDPCPQLERQAGIWRFDADEGGQTQLEDGLRYATGIRNAVALDWNHRDGALYVLQHGRDSLAQLWPDLYTPERSAELPAEEMFRVTEGDDFGWPYCYYDGEQGHRVLAPEYGGEGTEVGRCADTAPTAAAYPAHWAPNDLVFYTGDAFPERYRGGAFIAFHGSWNRMPFPQQGYNVVYQPFEDGRPTGEYEVFADGFADTDEIRMPGDAEYRPTGLAVGPDGSLYVADDSEGRIWRIRAADETAAAGSSGD